MESNKYLQFERVSDSVTELYIYGDIRKPDFWDKLFGEEDEGRVDALSFAEQLAKVDTPILLVRINSYGGSVSEALAIYNLLKDANLEVRTVCDGFACSAASVIFCAGQKRIMPKTSLLMIHNAWTRAEGNADELRKTADDLEKITQPSIEAYKAVSNLSEEEIKQLMADETWISADEALEWGFATETREDDAQQSLDKYYLAKLVNENKELKKQISEIMESTPKVDDNSWSAFFNSKKS